jgi:hypothetical protein
LAEGKDAWLKAQQEQAMAKIAQTKAQLPAGAYLPEQVLKSMMLKGINPLTVSLEPPQAPPGAPGGQPPSAPAAGPPLPGPMGTIAGSAGQAPPGAPPGGGGGGGVVTVQTPADAMKLPPGTRFRTPDGREFIR